MRPKDVRGSGVSGEGAPATDTVDARGLTVGVVAAQWHEGITTALLERAVATLVECGVDEPRVVRVPGAFELPLAAQALARSCDAVVTLGVVIRGGTPHFEYVCGAATDGLARVALDSGTPIGFGLLTCDTEEQAWARSGVGDAPEDKGREATLAALQTALVLRKLPGARAGFRTV
ncbi:MAG: 6,7-dimethyl-8-ribityllumazine synthase [Frankiaceae bacterium]|nr:6,7-dimethyl-8-ribityllumazine synthase [Frankiaceae bacterium]